MNKKLKVFIATLILTMNIVGTSLNLPVKAEVVTPEGMLQIALNQKTFYHFNMAYAEIMKVQDTAKRDMLLGKLASLTDVVWTQDIKNINAMITDMCNTASGKTYDHIEAAINKSNLNQTDKNYLLWELTSWGRKLVWTSDYVNGVDQVNNAWLQLISPNINDVLSKSEAEIRKIKNEPSRIYLLGELDKVKTINNKNIETVGRVVELSSEGISREQKVAELGSILKSGNSLSAPNSYKEGTGLNLIAGWVFSPLGQRAKTIGDVQNLINNGIASNEAIKFKGQINTGTYVDLTANSGTEAIDITNRVIQLISPVAEGVSYEIITTGFLRGDGSKIPSDYLTLKGGKIYLEAKNTSTIVNDSVIIKVSYKDGYTTTQIRVRINP